MTALADPTRRAILVRLAAGDATVNELAEPFAVSQPAISKHVKVLRSAGLLSQTRSAQRRPCHLEAKALREVVEWTEQFRRSWESSFQRLDAFLTQMEQTAPATPRQETTDDTQM